MDPSRVPGTPVRFIWHRRSGSPLDAVGGRGQSDPVVEVVVFAGDGTSGDRELVTFEVEAALFPATCPGPQPGELVGEAEPNGALGLRTLGGMVWPLDNPRPGRR